jgi:hypothetical protein
MSYYNIMNNNTHITRAAAVPAIPLLIGYARKHYCAGRTTAALNRSYSIQNAAM